MRSQRVCEGRRARADVCLSPEQGLCGSIILAFEVGLSWRVEKQRWMGGCIVEQ